MFKEDNMETTKEVKEGTVKELAEDIKACGFYPGEQLKPVEDKTESEIPIEQAIAKTKLELDASIQEILSHSGLPLYLFDYLITSVLADIRKADLDILRTQKV
jgi:hypothetical protein